MSFHRGAREEEEGGHGRSENHKGEWGAADTLDFSGYGLPSRIVNVFRSYVIFRFLLKSSNLSPWNAW